MEDPSKPSSSPIKAKPTASRRNDTRRHGRALAVLLILAVLVGLPVAAFLLFANSKVKENREEIKVAEQEPNEPMNVLVMGSDSRENLTPEQLAKFGGTEVVYGRRADTIILLHLDERAEKAVLVHIPRDLLVLDSEGKAVKINGMYSSGPDAMVEAVTKLTGLPIHHYLEVDFNGFNRITEALGGVDIFFERAVRDEDSGLDQPQGCVKIEGDQALSFVRARKIDDDFGRIRRQQLFIKLMVDKIATPAVFLRPDRIVSLMDVFSQAVKYDSELSLGDVGTIGLRLRKFNSEKLDLRVVPSAAAEIDGVSYVVADEGQASALFSALANRSPLPDYGRTGLSSIHPKDVQVSVLNGTEVPALAVDEGVLLKRKGFQVVDTSDTTPHSSTTVYYVEGFRDQGQLLATTYGAPLEALPSTIVTSASIAVVLGADFAAKVQGHTSPTPEATYVPAQLTVHALRSVAPEALVRACRSEDS